ncbi:hypothetical protein UNPA324_09035 [Bradyrhizobium sp. UNPA324]|nr:hypothetical protein UNPA324_09035 [Bradyrhizobium sp. UNPA324]
MRRFRAPLTSGGGGAVDVVVGSAKEALEKARELEESGGEVLINDLSGKTINPGAVAEIAAREERHGTERMRRGRRGG